MKTFILTILFSTIAYADTYTANLTVHETEDSAVWVSDNPLVTIDSDIESLVTLHFRTLTNPKCFISNASEEFYATATCFPDHMDIAFIEGGLKDTLRPIEIPDGSVISIIITGDQPEVCTDKCIKRFVK